MVSRGPRRAKTLAAIVGAGAVAAVSFTAPAVAGPTQGPVGGANYVALGSSFGSGFGQLPYEASLEGGYCGRSLLDYPQQVSATLHLTLTDATCGGATTANILTTAQYGFIPPQINSVASDTNLVTITVGGNDVNYLLDLDRNSCANDPSAIPAMYQPLICTTVDPGATQAALATLQQNLVNVVQAVQAKAPHARIVLADYLTILPLFNKGCAALPLTPAQIAYSRNVANQLAAATVRTAVQTRVGYLPLSLLSLGHSACSAQPWVNPWSSSISVGAQYHPNATGIAFEAKAIDAYLALTGFRS